MSSQIRCLRCRGIQVESSGDNPTILICANCGQYYRVVVSLDPIEPPHKPNLLESSLVESSAGTTGRCEVPVEDS